jgi:hypothetical protein
MAIPNFAHLASRMSLLARRWRDRRAVPAALRVPVHKEDPNKQIQLDRMKWRATDRCWRVRDLRVLYPRATVPVARRSSNSRGGDGGLADWFAIWRCSAPDPDSDTAIIPSWHRSAAASAGSQKISCAVR